jgi:glycosyltransferase involved in cell wall biosynthesis
LLKLVAVVDLTRSCGPLYVDPQYESVFVLVTFEEAPICTFELRCDSGTRQITSQRLRTEALRHSGERVWQRGVSTRFEEPRSALPPISVVVCTRDRVHLLERCLHSLCALDYPEFEVVVVDNCSRDADVKAVVEHAGFRYVRENRPGLDWARNRGIREARHDIVSYIDDDARATRGWLRGIARGFQDPGVMAVTGLVLPAELETEAQSIFEWYGGMSKGFQPQTFRADDLAELGCYAAHNFGVGANMSFRRHIFERVGTFDTMLDVGTPSSGAGDVDMFHRIVAGGSSIRYQPEAMIWHRHRRSYDGLRRQIYANGRGYGVYLIKTWRASQSHGVMRYAARWMSGWVLRRVVRSLLGREKFPRDLIWAEFRGALAAPRAYFATLKSDRRVRRIHGEFDDPTRADVRGQA